MNKIISSGLWSILGVTSLFCLHGMGNLTIVAYYGSISENASKQLANTRTKLTLTFELEQKFGAPPDIKGYRKFQSNLRYDEESFYKKYSKAKELEKEFIDKALILGYFTK